MLKLDKQWRLQLNATVREVSGFKETGKVYVIFSDNSILLKRKADFGIDKIVDTVSVDSKGRIILTKMLLALLHYNTGSEFLVWAEPGVVHIEKVAE